MMMVGNGHGPVVSCTFFLEPVASYGIAGLEAQAFRHAITWRSLDGVNEWVRDKGKIWTEYHNNKFFATFIEEEYQVNSEKNPIRARLVDKSRNIAVLLLADKAYWQRPGENTENKLHDGKFTLVK